jgi:glycosyltransferase involved in cell wall biosynthesis
VLENGVDSDYFAPTAGRRAAVPAVIFTGVMDYAPNVDAVLWFVQHGWPIVRQRHPTAGFAIVGSSPSPAVRALHGDQGIQVTGRVADTRPYFDAAWVAIAPLRIARGIQNKVLEAMSMGLPTVATPTALAGVEASVGEHVVSAAAGSETGRVVADLLADAPRRERLGQAARQRVLERYRWNAVRQRLADLIEVVLQVNARG